MGKSSVIQACATCGADFHPDKRGSKFCSLRCFAIRPGTVPIRFGLASAEMRQWFVETAIPEPNTGCWLWGGSQTTAGYGHFNGPEGGVYAHRYGYELLRGPIPPGLELDHLCRTWACVNPDHLEPVTHAVNMSRSIWRENAKKITHCPQGHEYTPDNVYYNHRGCRNCKICVKARAKAWDIKTGRRPHTRHRGPSELPLSPKRHSVA